SCLFERTRPPGQQLAEDLLNGLLKRMKAAMSTPSGSDPNSSAGPPPPDRRASPRYPCSLKATCETNTAGQPQSCPSTVINMSKPGLGLSLGRRFEPGTQVAIVIRSAKDIKLAQMMVRVLHVTMKADDNWVHGCVLADCPVGPATPLAS